jgi:trimeric autotransporter adhesin
MGMRSICLTLLICLFTLVSNASIGPITGPTNVCTGSIITLSDTTTGGVWSSSNIAVAQVGYYNGVVHGISQGLVTITYTKGAAVTIASMYVNPHPFAIGGTAVVCAGATTTLTNTVSGGTWSSATGNTSVAGGVVTGISAGTDTITYMVTYTCGTATSQKVVTVNPSPDLSVITGNSLPCVSQPDTLFEAQSGGSWVSSATAVISVSSAGILTGHTAGTATISYKKTVSGCSNYVVFPVTVNPLPGAGSITGAASLCQSATITLADTATGGSWNSMNANASVSPTGVVTGVLAGQDTIIFTKTNMCATATTKKIITIYALPVAGSITTHSDSVCVGAYDTLHVTGTGGAWGKSNSFASVSGTGVVHGVAAGADTIHYTVTSPHGCGTSTAYHTINVLPLPVISSITGNSSVCVGSKLTMADATSGGVWTIKNSSLDSINAMTGVLTAIGSGKDSVFYTTSNYCGSLSKYKIVTLNALPDAGRISGPDSQVCLHATLILTDTMHNGAWSKTNTKASITSTGSVKGVAVGLDTVRFIVTSTVGCGKDTATMVITVNPLPFAGPITGPMNICMGTAISLHDTTTGGSWVPAGSGVFISDSGVVSPFAVGVDTILYVVHSPTCGNDTVKHTVYIQSADNCRAAVAVMEQDGAKFTYYPNPSSDDQLHVAFGDAQGLFVVVIRDISGRTLVSANVTGTDGVVNVSGLRSGLYVVSCYDSTGALKGVGKLTRQ